MSTPRFVVHAAAIAFALTGGGAFGQAQKAADPAAAPPPAANGPTVKVRQGEAQGIVADGVAVFKGLPFAAPPVGDLRWRVPQLPAKWSGIRAANAFSSTCMQAEDCLYLNVYEPADAKRGAKLPVMVWIHGGAFLFGSGSAYDGSQFARQGVIVVTVNYRLGRAGWFAHPALTAENPKGLLGNYGLMDQIAALNWVADNIKEFGGDPKNVTIFGESAGAISVNYLMLAPQAKGLFNKALSESGFGRLAARPISSVEQNGVTFAEKAGVHGSDAAAAKALRALPWSELTANVAGIGAAEQILPMADGKMITGSAADGFAQGKEAHVPYLLGGNSDEASLTRRGLNAAERFASIQQRREAFLAAYDPDNTRRCRPHHRPSGYRHLHRRTRSRSRAAARKAWQCHLCVLLLVYTGRATRDRLWSDARRRTRLRVQHSSHHAVRRGRQGRRRRGESVLGAVRQNRRPRFRGWTPVAQIRRGR